MDSTSGPGSKPNDSGSALKLDTLNSPMTTTVSKRNLDLWFTVFTLTLLLGFKYRSSKGKCNAWIARTHRGIAPLRLPDRPVTTAS